MALISIQLKSGYLTGLVDQKIPQEYELAGEIGRRFQLIGRMTYGAYLAKASETAPTMSSTGRRLRIGSAAAPMTKKPSDATHFFKVSWPEDDRRLEGEIIKEVRKRIRGLDEKHWSSVEKHIPLVKATARVPGTSTAIIRIILGLPTAGSRSQYWMISKKLSGLSPILSDFNEFKRMYWEIIRCMSFPMPAHPSLIFSLGHRFLWNMGISHGDISFNNLMYNPETRHGILNDFDLASVMEPSTQIPQTIGHRRTGTLVFMASDLLKDDESIGGGVARRYYHELESFVWVLLWAGLSERNYRHKHILQWVDLTPTAVYEKKTTWIVDFRSKLAEMKTSESPYYDVLHSSLKELALSAAVFSPENDEVRDVEFFTALTKAWTKQGEEWMGEVSFSMPQE